MAGWEPYKEGVDFEWVKGENSNALVRRFYPKEEKQTQGSPQRESMPKVARKPKATKSRQTAIKKPVPIERSSLDSKGNARKAFNVKDVRKAIEDTPKASTKRPVTSYSSRKREYTYDDWRKMSRSARKAAGLPVSLLGGEIEFKRFMTGITGKEYTSSGDLETNKRVVNRRYAKGGMVRSNCGASTSARRGK